jgi:hypothetical protein
LGLVYHKGGACHHMSIVVDADEKPEVESVLVKLVDRNERLLP